MLAFDFSVGIEASGIQWPVASGLTLFRAGSERFDSGRGGAFGPPSDLETTHQSNKRKTAFDRSLKDLQLLHKTFSGQVNIEVTRGHQR